MSDPIDRKAAIDAVCKVCLVCDYNKCKGRNHFSKWCEEITALREIPSAEPKKGKWTKAYDGNDGHVKCTACFKTYDYITHAQYFNYCPNCGAKMGG